MVKNKMDIVLGLKDDASAPLKRAKKNVDGFTKKSTDGFVKLAAQVYLAEKAFRIFFNTTTKVVKGLVETSSKVENLNTRLKVLLGSTEKGNQVFKDMAELAGEVPKTYDEIMESATQLAGVVKDGTKEINQLMPIIVDISAATGLSVQETTGQIIRMYSAGAASADMFRERGISAALGFKAGASVSNKETMDILIKQWEDGTGKFVGASEALATTWVGMTSMMEDAWFQFKTEIGAELFDKLKEDMTIVLSIIKKSKEEGGEYADAVKAVAGVFADMHDSIIQFAPTAVVSMGQLLDIFKEIAWVIKGVEGAWVSFIAGFIDSLTILPEFSIFGKEIINKEELDEAANIAIQDLQELSNDMLILREEANEDYSQKMEERVEIFRKSLEKERSLYHQQIVELEKIDIVRTRKEKKLLFERQINYLAELKIGEKAYNEANDNKLGSLKNTLQKAAGLNEEFAMAYKVVAIAEATMSTASGVARALKDYPFPESLIVGSLVAAAGAVQIAAIAAQGFAEGTDSVPAMLTPGEMVIPNTFADAIRSGRLSLSGGESSGSGSTVNIEINNPNVSDENGIEELTLAISEMLDDELERI